MQINSILSRLKLQKKFSSRLYYLCEECKVISGEEPSSPAIVIVSRKHYKEVRKTYSAVSKKEVRQILELQSKGLDIRPVTKIMPNEHEDGFDVVSVEFDQSLAQILPSAALLIPESTLLATSAEARLAISAKTPAGDLFFCKQGELAHSAFRGGLITNFHSFLLACGIPSDVEVLEFSEEEYRAFLQQQIIEAEVQQVLTRSSFYLSKSNWSARQLHSLYLLPLLSSALTLGAIVIYLTLQGVTLESRSKELMEQTAGLIDKRIEIDTKQTRNRDIYTELSSFHEVHPSWWLVGAAMDAGMDVSRFQYNDGNYFIRGKSESASRILGELNALERVKSTSIEGDVSKSGSKDLFIVKIQLHEKVSSSEG
ncbi:hypothetical protein [Pseudoalteromonas pernae]|uniref:hypothetical protein n=1 Tax=Pseudoalteromonas pernae TaxID=3118054 RepID=UPI0032420811